ncbi:MAG TPA: rSAM-modified peptide [Bacteroidetes bacterium]|nr:rSAM-modified peptide [Bacteroidota bacterium]
MKKLNQIELEKFNEFTLSDEEMILVRGGDSDGEKGMTIPPVTEPEI